MHGRQRGGCRACHWRWGDLRRRRSWLRPIAHQTTRPEPFAHPIGLGYLTRHNCFLSGEGPCAHRRDIFHSPATPIAYHSVIHRTTCSPMTLRMSPYSLQFTTEFLNVQAIVTARIERPGMPHALEALGGHLLTLKL